MNAESDRDPQLRADAESSNGREGIGHHGPAMIGTEGSPLKVEDGDYWKWDCWKWGTHRVNCYPGGCPYRVYVKDGEVVREEIACNYPPFEDPDHRVPDYNPRGCQKGGQHSKAMYGKDRVRHPMKRAGERGGGKWEQIGWDQAFDEIGGKLAEIIVEHGAESLIDDHSANGIGVMRGGGEATAPALMGVLGGTAFDLNFLTGDFNPGVFLTFGQYEAVCGTENWFLPDTIVLMSNPVYANIPEIHYFLEARYRGAKIISICPDKNPTAQFADEWVPIDWSADPALWLGVCKILVDRGWVDTEFMTEQTDLPIAVRADTKRYLRESDLVEDGSEEQFYAIDSTDGTVGQIPTGTLEPAFDYDLTGTCKVTLADGTDVEVTTVYNMLVERLADYTPEDVKRMSGVHPSQLEVIAELCKPPRSVFVFSNPNTGKLYHGDLVERSFCYMLALTGNVGKPGTGTRGMSAGFDFLASMPLVSMMPKEVLENPDPVGTALSLLLMLIEDYRERVKMDPSMPYTEAVFGALRELMKVAGTLAQPVHFWMNHAGYDEVWKEHLDDPDAVRTIAEYAAEAKKEGWTEPWDKPAKDVQPRAMFVSGSNPLRRHRGRSYLENVWPQLELIFTADTRWSTTALMSDYVLPAASYYEYADTKYTTATTRFTVFTDDAAGMLAEAKSDRMIVLGIIKSVEKHLTDRGIENYFVGEREIVVDEMYWRATAGGRYGDTNEDEERMVDDALRSLSKMGWMEGTDGSGTISLDKLREDGIAWATGRPPWQSSVALNSDQIAGEVLYPFRDQIEQKIPFKTTTRRMQLLADHPWFVEADEHLVKFKEPPAIGGRKHEVRLTGGHVRWSIHGVWHTSEEMMKLHRGEPFAFINEGEAHAKGIADHDFIRVFNEYADFVVRAKLSPCVRPDQLVIYHAWEPYQHPGWQSQDRLLPGPPKGLHFAGGYRHYEYSLWSWSPSQSDRQTNVSYEKAAG
ncbi:MAG: molybdopterin-dependent oxidoreductase [Actinobacteria bacterium]|nr:molybdopterin-dependent oxidoreductase [Actinomycetota bacterium]